MPFNHKLAKYLRIVNKTCYDAAMKVDGKTPLAIKGGSQNVRLALRELGNPAPFGYKNEKTGCMSTYKEVGETCHSNCPYAEDRTCFAMYGKTKICSMRATGQDATLSYSGCLTLAAIHNVPVRLHVSGDFYRNNKLDVNYVNDIAHVNNAARTYFRKKRLKMPETFAYSHTPYDKDWKILEYLMESTNIVVLRSDYWGPGGAVVWPHDKMEEACDKYPDLKLIRCWAQKAAGKEFVDAVTGKVSNITCASCGMCYKARKNGWTIVFNPHGKREKALREKILAN